MLFLVFSKDRVFVREGRGRWSPCRLPSTFINTDLICGFYREDFFQWRKLSPREVSFFELGRFFEPEKDREEDIFEFIELCIEHGLIEPESGRLRTIDYARQIILNRLGPILSKEVEEQEDVVYYGGRTEFYKVESEGDIVYYDMNSAYGWAMSQPLPDRNRVRVYRGLRYEDILELREKYFVLFEGEVYQERFYPVCPVRIGEEVYYPVGNIRGIWTDYELTLLERDEVISIERVWAYPYSKLSLADVVEDFYQRRKISKAHKTFYKWQIVLLYGLIGWKQPGFLKSRLAGACITARVRHRLYQAMQKGAEYGDLLYCDTDAFFLKADQNGHEKMLNLLPVKEGMGNWGIRSRINSLKVYGFKRYITQIDNKLYITFSGERIDLMDEEGNLYRKNYYTGKLYPVEIKEQELPKRKILEDLSTVPWTMQELFSLTQQQSSTKQEKQNRKRKR